MDAQALGQYLRQTREAKEITLEDAENALRIRRRILESFELGDFNIPDSSSIQIRGFIRNYARYLALDDDRVIEMYETSQQDITRTRRLSGRAAPAERSLSGRSSNGAGKKRSTQPAKAAQPNAPTNGRRSTSEMPAASFTPVRRRRNWLAMLLFLVLGVGAIAVVAVIIVEAIGGTDTGLPERDSGGGMLDLPPTALFTPLPTIESALLPTSSALTVFTGDGVLVQIEFTQRAWIRLAVDGTDQYAGLVRPGTVMEYPANDTISLRSSNAEALNVTWNGQRQPLLGGRGQMVDVVFSRTGVQVSSGPGFAPTPVQSNTPLPTPTDAAGAIVAQLTPTNTPGPSPTASDTPTPTLTPSITPTASNTPTPSDTPSVTPIPSSTLPPSNTPSPTLTPSQTNTPTNTPIPTDTTVPTATAILPPRVTPVDVTPTKAGA